VRFQGRCYRGHDPRWSFTPLSGAGAAKTGGRFNRKGERALYLACDIMTAVGECTQGLASRLHPLTMVEYDIDCEPIADLSSDAGRSAHGVTLEDIACPWLAHLRKGSDAPSWRAADRLKAGGFVGLLAPSFASGAGPANINLILWQWGDALPAQALVYDPEKRLPGDQRSWGLG